MGKTPIQNYLINQRSNITGLLIFTSKNLATPTSRSQKIDIIKMALEDHISGIQEKLVLFPP